MEILLGEVQVVSFTLDIFDKEKGEIVLKRHFIEKDLAKDSYNNLIKVYSKILNRFTIKLFDVDKQTYICSYDSDDDL